MEGGTLQWMSPELLDPEKSGSLTRRPTKESDCYALGMVIYEILGGCAPFAVENSFKFVILRKILDGEHPERPQGEAGKLLTDDIWDVVERCWETEPSKRTTAKVVLRCLEGNPPNIIDGGDDQSDAVSIDS